MNDTINVSLKRNKTINLSGSFSLGNPLNQCQCNLKITDTNYVLISPDLIKCTGLQISSGYTAVMTTPYVAQGSGLYNNSSTFSLLFEVSENMDVKIYMVSTCDNPSFDINVKY